MAILRFEIAGPVATIALAKPQVRNALTGSDYAEIAEAAERAARDEAVRVLVLTGDGPVFCAGGDLKAMPRRNAVSAEARAEGLRRDSRLVELFRDLRVPTVAALNGPAIGMGLSLALMCDFRLASEKARLGAGFVKVGAAGDFGIFHFLPRLVGTAKAMEILMLGDPIEAPEALRLGLLHRVFPEDRFREEVRAFAARLAEGPPVALAVIKRLLYRAEHLDLSRVLDHEAVDQTICLKSADHAEALAAFAEKRRPVFRGR